MDQRKYLGDGKDNVADRNQQERQGALAHSTAELPKHLHLLLPHLVAAAQLVEESRRGFRVLAKAPIVTGSPAAALDKLSPGSRRIK